MPLPLAGAKIKASDFAAIFPNGADAWPTYVPTLTQGVTVTKTVTEAKHFKVARWVTAKFNLAMTSAGTAANAIVVGLPEPAATTGGTIGSFTFLDTSTGQLYTGSAILVSTTTVQFICEGTSLLGATGSNFALAVASGDQISGEVSYESAS